MQVLAIGAHPDDIELGCGGALAAHRARGDEITMLVLTTGEQGPQDARSRVNEQEEAADLLDAALYWGGFDDGLVPEGRAAVDIIQRVIRERGIDTIYTHARDDTHQDHRSTSAASLAAARRSQRVLMYESPTSIGFAPSMHIDIAPYVEAKLELIRAHFSQVLKNGLVDLEAVEAQARYRGFTARMRYAESFEAFRFAWPLGPDTAPAKGRPATTDLDLNLAETLR